MLRNGKEIAKQAEGFEGSNGRTTSKSGRICVEDGCREPRQPHARVAKDTTRDEFESWGRYVYVLYHAANVTLRLFGACKMLVLVVETGSLQGTPGPSRSL